MDVYIGEKLREFRILKGYSQRELGEFADLTFQQVQKYESGYNRVSASTLYIFAEQLNVPIKRFFPE